MIEFNLKQVLKKANKSMTDIHNQTGISKNTLSLLANGSSRGIQFDTLDKLLTALDTTVEQLIIQKFDIELTPENLVINYVDNEMAFDIDVIDNTENKAYTIPVKISYTHTNDILILDLFEDKYVEEDDQFVFLDTIIRTNSTFPGELFQTNDNDLESLEMQLDLYGKIFRDFEYDLILLIYSCIRKDEKNKVESAKKWNYTNKKSDSIYVFRWNVLPLIKKFQNVENLTEPQIFTSVVTQLEVALYLKKSL